MTRDEAKALLGRTALLMFEHDGTSTLDGDKTLHIIDQIFDYFGEQLQDKDESLKLAMGLSEHMLIELKTERDIKEYLAKELKAKDEEIEKLKSIIEEAIRKQIGVEPYSWSDYKIQKDNA